MAQQSRSGLSREMRDCTVGPKSEKSERTWVFLEGRVSLVAEGQGSGLVLWVGCSIGGLGLGIEVWDLLECYYVHGLAVVHGEC